jgi:hypothetical protein
MVICCYWKHSKYIRIRTTHFLPKSSQAEKALFEFE